MKSFRFPNKYLFEDDSILNNENNCFLVVLKYLYPDKSDEAIMKIAKKAGYTKTGIKIRLLMKFMHDHFGETQLRVPPRPADVSTVLSIERPDSELILIVDGHVFLASHEIIIDPNQGDYKPDRKVWAYYKLPKNSIGKPDTSVDMNGRAYWRTELGQKGMNDPVTKDLRFMRKVMGKEFEIRDLIDSKILYDYNIDRLFRNGILSNV